MLKVSIATQPRDNSRCDAFVCREMNIIKGQRFYNTTYNEYNRIVLYSVLYTYNGTIEASLMPFQTRSVLSATTGTGEVPFLVGDKLHRIVGIAVSKRQFPVSSSS